jgi:hypothetical protein
VRRVAGAVSGSCLRSGSALAAALLELAQDFLDAVDGRKNE